MKIIVGLGNPGNKYARSRHNAGFRVVDRFAALNDFPRATRKRQVDYLEKEMQGERIVLVKPRSYMNSSGVALRSFVSNTPLWGARLLDDRLLVIHDDLDLPFGKIRYRCKGSSGGHRGVDSIIDSLQTSEFGRLKIGIGRREGADSVDYVLEALHADEDRLFEKVASHAAATLPVWIEEGGEACANRFNGSGGEIQVGSDQASDQ